MRSKSHFWKCSLSEPHTFLWLGLFNSILSKALLFCFVNCISTKNQQQKKRKNKQTKTNSSILGNIRKSYLKYIGWLENDLILMCNDLCASLLWWQLPNDIFNTLTVLGYKMEARYWLSISLFYGFLFHYFTFVTELFTLGWRMCKWNGLG